MKTTIKFLGAVILGGGLFLGGCGKKPMKSMTSLKNPEVAAQLKSFVAEKEAQANAATNAAAPGYAAFFAAAERGDWLAVSNAFQDFRKHAGQYQHSDKTDKTDERLHGLHDAHWRIDEQHRNGIEHTQRCHAASAPLIAGTMIGGQKN